MNITEEIKELIEKIPNDKKVIAEKIITEINFILEQMEQTKQFEFYKVNPKNKKQMRPTLAIKQYKELNNLLNVNIKTLLSLVGDNNDESNDSLLAQYLKMRGVKDNEQ